ncbi:hypothetical protein [Streptomyces sp. NPDC101455]|uniref:hypothetical protein n=1 Tax=Streptomyces sp. NPDC101455 TaxID=3366142 RepID=UPI0037F24190
MGLRPELLSPSVPLERVEELGREIDRIETLVEVVRRILAGDTDAEYYLRLFTTNVTHPAASDLIFHPPSDLGEPSAEQIVDAALAHRPDVL